MPRKNLLFCQLSMKNTSKSVRNRDGVLHSWRFTLFVLGLFLCLFVPDYVEAVFTPPSSCSSTTWIYQNRKVQNISCRGQNLFSVPTDSKEGSDVIQLDLSNNEITSLSNNEFQYFTNLEVLDLSYNKISVFNIDTFSNLTNLQSLNLAGNNLTTLPSGTFTSITVSIFNVSHNTHLVFGRRKSTTLRVLDLSYTNLQSVTKEHFANLVNLEEVYLSHNNLTTLDQHLFKDLVSLKLIDLSWNEITFLVNDQVFKKCDCLKTLDLSHNLITVVHRDFLNDVNGLSNLDLSNNRISSLDKTTFDEIPEIEELYINDNLLTSLDEDLFNHMTSLQTLNLGTNLLTSLNKDQFKDLAALTALYLSNNLLTDIHSDLFKFNLNLQDLSLSANQLTTIPTDVFDSQTSFEVDFSGNPFICSCEIRDFLYSVRYSTNKVLKEEETTLCTQSSDDHIYLDYDHANCSGNLGAVCSVTYECKVRNSQCSNGKCICPDSFYDTNTNATDGGQCKAKVALDSECPGLDTACLGSHVECVAKSPSSSDTYCLCEPNYYDDNPQYVGGTCRLKVQLGVSCTTIHNMCQPDYSLCGSSGTCECQTGYYDNDGMSNTGGECRQVLPLHATCNQTYQCGPDNSECSNNACTCLPGYYDFTNVGECRGPSGFYSCYPDNSSSLDIVFEKVKVVSSDDECKNYCFEENVRYYHIEGSNICICGNSTSTSCCPKVSDECLSRYYLGPTVALARAGIRVTHIPRLIAGVSHELTVSASLAVITQINLSFGDSQTVKTINASSVTVQHTYTHSDLFWLKVSACAASKHVCEDAYLPVRVQVPAVNLTTFMTAITRADVSSNLTDNIRSTFTMGLDIDVQWSRTYQGAVLKRKSCKPGWAEHREKCIKLVTTSASYSSAKTSCMSDGGSLLKVNYHQELSEIVTALGASSETLLIGAQKVGKVWQWSDASKTFFFDDDLNSAANGNCVTLVGSSSSLTSASCSGSFKYVCMSDPEDCPHGGDLWSNDYCYILASTQYVSAKNWNAANDFCKTEYGGWLANVTDASVQSKITSLLTAKGANSEAWIGLSNQQVKGSYLWGDFSSYDYTSAYKPTVTSHNGDCFVATSNNDWNAQDCTNIRDFVCQYSERIQRLSVPSFVLGTADLQITGGQNLQHAVAATSFPSSVNSSYEMLLFPGLPFSRSGIIRQTNFRSVSMVSGNYDMSFQIFRPVCTTGYLYQAGCVPTMHSSCESGAYSCTSNPGCSDSEYFCLLSKSCVFKNESCTCNSVSVPASTSGCSNTGTVSKYELITQLQVTFTGTGERWYGVTGDLAVQEGDIIGLQYPTGKNIVNCEDRTGGLDQQKVIKQTTSNLFVKKDTLMSPFTYEDMTCDMQFVYTQDLEQNLPNNLGYMNTVGNYQLAISILETGSKSVSVSLEESVADVELVYPNLGLTNTSLTSLGAVYTEWNVAYHFTIAAGRGTNLSLKCALFAGQTFSFSNTCHSSVTSEVGDKCNSSMWWSDSPFAYFSYNTSTVGTTSTTVEISNSLGAVTYSLDLITEKRITGVTFSLVTPSRLPNCVRKGTTARFDLENTEGTDPRYSYTVAGTSATSTNSSLFYSFPIVGTFSVAGTISNNLDSQTISVSISVKQEASFTNCILLDTPYIAAVGISFNLKLQCDCIVGSEVNTHWMFSDGTANITSAISRVSTSPMIWTQPVTFSSVSTVNFSVYAMDSFESVQVDGSVSVYNALPTITVTANSSNILLNTVVEITVNVPTSPGNYHVISYDYDFGDSNTLSSGANVVTHTYTTGSNYTVRVTASNGPSSQTATMYIVVYEAVTVSSFTNDGPKQTGNSVTFSAVVSSGNFLSYRYVSSNLAFDVTKSTRTFTHMYAASGNYTVTLTVSNMLSSQVISTQAYVMDPGDLYISEFLIDGNAVSGCYESTIGRMYKVELIHYSAATIVCDWNYGDGNTFFGTSCSKTHAFSTAANFIINVTAKYNVHSASESISQQVCVQEKITTPAISIEPTVTLPSTGSVTKNVSVTVATGSPLTYVWSTNATSIISTGSILPVEFTSEGTYYFTVNVSNNINSETVTKTVQVVEELSGLNIVCSSCIVKSGKHYIQQNVATVFSVSTTTGSGSFAWDFGDTSTGTGTSNTHTYTTISSYNITVTASSSVTTAITQYITIYVEAAISSVIMKDRLYDWLTNKQDSSVKDLNIVNTGKFQATVTPSGMDLEYIWRCESDAIEETTQINEWDHVFTSKGSKSCTVMVKNSLGNMTSAVFKFFVIEKVVSSSLQVEEDGKSLTGTNETYTYKAALNKLITFMVTSSQIVPDTVEYFLRLRKKNTGTSIYALENSTIDNSDPTLSYRLQQNALYKLEASVTNSLGVANIEVYVEVVEAVSGPYINTSPGQDGNITLSSSITLTGGATNGEYKVFNWFYAVAPSGQVLPTTTSASIVITPAAVGLYIVTLEVSNSVSGPVSANYTINVMIGVSGVQIGVTMPFTDAVKVGSSLSFIAQIATGTSPSYQWNVMVAGTSLSNGTSQNFVHQFNIPALHNVTLFVENYASNGLAYKEIYSLNDVPTFTLSMTGATYVASIKKFTAASNTDIQFSSSITNTEYMQFDWKVGGATVAATETLQKNFTNPAEYSVQLNASNLISFEQSGVTIIIQDVISAFTVQNCMGTYLMNSVITLTSSYLGTDITVEWTRQNYGSVMTSAATTVQYSTVGIYSVNVTGRNYVSQETKNCFITIQGEVSNLIVQASVYKYVGYPVTFNVTGNYINPAKFTWVFSHGVNKTTTNTPTLDLSFIAKGNYTLQVTVANDVSSSSVNISIQVEELGCSAPTVAVVGSTERQGLRAREAEFSVDIATGGCSSYSSANSWKIYPATSCKDTLQNEVVLPSSVKTDIPSIVLPSNSLSYGTYCVVFKHLYENTPAEAFKFINYTIIQSPLVSLIKGGHKVGVRVATTLTLDATESRDPDNVPGTTLNFVWSCTQSMGTVAAVSVCNSINSITNASKTLTGLTLSVNDVYVVMVTVSAAGRTSSTFTQTITILSSTAPVISISCISCQANEHYFLTRSRSVSFEGTCTGCDTASFQWTVTENATGTAVTIDSTKTTTDTNQLNFVLLNGVIEDNKAYIFKLEATVGSETGQAQIVLAPSSKPSTGACTLSPSAGVVVLTDKVTYSCSNVVDSDTLSTIYYKVTVRSTTSYKTPYIAYYGTKSVNSFFAVPFPGTNYGSVQIEISAVNFYGAETVLYTRTVSFVAPTLLTGQQHKIDYIVQQMLDNMRTIVRQNNPPLLLQYCMSVLSYLNDQSENNVGTLAERMAIRDVIMTSLSGLPLTSIYNIQQMATAIEYLVEYTEEVSLSTLSSAVTEIEAMTTLLEFSVAKGADKRDYDSNTLIKANANMQQALKSLSTVTSDPATLTKFGTLTNYVLQVSSSVQATSYSSDTEQTQALIIKSMKSSVNLLMLPLRTQLADEEPIQTVTPDYEVNARHVSTKKIAQSHSSNLGTSIHIPGDILDSRYNELSVFQIIYITKIIQYNFGFSNLLPKNTLSLTTSFYKPSGDSVTVDNLSAGDEVTMYLFKSNVSAYPINETAFHYSSGYNPQLHMNYTSKSLNADSDSEFVISMPSEDGVSVHIQIRGNFTSSNANLLATLYKNDVPYPETSSDVSKRPKTINKDMMDNPAHDHADYTVFISPSDYSSDDAFKVRLRASEAMQALIGIYESRCEFFNEVTEEWDNEGCVPQEESIATCIKCACNHLTSFGGSLFVSPDKLSFNDLSDVDFTSNPVAIITCSVILGLYIILVVAFRKLDMMDLKRISLIPLCGKDGSFKYEVTIVTGRLPGAGTTAHVGIRLVGEYGKSARQHVIKNGSFQRNCSDTFIIAYDVNLGDLKKIQIWHDNRGTSPSWYLSHVIVNDLQTDHKFYFFGNTWLSLEQENGSIQKELKVAGANDLSKFSYRLKTALFNSLADKHLWLSLFNRPAQSRFTRVQRVTCCATILFTFVMVNAMWYGLLKKDNTELGLEDFGWEEVVLAMVSNIMVLPVSIGLVYLFKKSRSKPNFFEHMQKPQTAQTLEIENLCENSQGGSFESTNTGAIPYDLERESTIDSVPHTAVALHRSRHVTKTQRENTDDSFIQKRTSVAVTKASSKSPLWNEDNIMKWPESVSFDDGADSRPSTASTMAAGPSVRQPPGKAGGSTPGASRKSKTFKKGDAGQLLDELDKLEHELKENESRSVKSSGSKRSSTNLRRPTMHKSQWGSLEDILHSDDESVAESSAKMRKRGSTTSQSTTGKFNPRSDPRISGNGGMWPKSRESVMSGQSEDRPGRGITSGLRPGYYSEMTMESRDIHIPVHKEKCSLPPWCIYIAYVLCALLAIFSTIIVILYCFKFGYKESIKWVLALIISLVLSFLVIEPLKALLIAVYVVATFKKVEEDEDEDFINIEPTFDNSNEKIKDVKFKPISGFALLQAKEEGRKIHRMNVMIRQFIAYVFYLWLIMVIVYVNFRYDTYLMTKHVENDFIAPTTSNHINFTNITTIDEVWDWTETVFIDSLYKENNTQDEEHAFLLGEARMRLIRGVTAKCEAANAASNLGASSLTDRTCYGQGNYDEDTSDYAEGWNDSNSNYSWRHYTAGELGSTHKIGHVATYGGGGYPQGLGTTSAETDSIIAHLKDKGWIDLQTRAIIFEFALYSAGSDMTSMVALLVEFPLTGGVITSYEIQSQKLLWFQKDTVEPLMVLECILFLVIIYSVIHLTLQIRELGKKFFKDIWSWYEMLTTLMALVSVGMYIGCVVEATNTFNRFLDNQTGFTNYERAMYVHVGMRYLHAWLLFLLMFKVVKQLRFIKFMYVYERTLSKAVGHLLGTGLIYIILLLVYAQVGYLMYGRFVSGFESVGHSITTLIVMIRGSFDFWPMLDYQPVFSHFYVYSYYGFAYGIMIALVISILTSTYKVVKSQMYYKATLEMQDYEMVDFMLKRFKLLTGIQKPKPAFRRVRFPGLPSVSSRSSSSYSNRSSASLHSAESITGPQYSEVKLRSMMARLAPTWQAVLRRMDKIVALDDEEESLVKKAEEEMKTLNWKCRINELERQNNELLGWKNQPSTSEKPPIGDSKQRQSILKRPGASKDNHDRKAPATVSGAQIRTAASTPADDSNGAQGRRPFSDQGVRVEPASTSKRRASSNDKSKIQTFFKSIKPSKSAWNK